MCHFSLGYSSRRQTLFHLHRVCMFVSAACKGRVNSRARRSKKSWCQSLEADEGKHSPKQPFQFSSNRACDVARTLTRLGSPTLTHTHSQPPSMLSHTQSMYPSPPRTPPLEVSMTHIPHMHCRPARIHACVFVCGVHANPPVVCAICNAVSCLLPAVLVV